MTLYAGRRGRHHRGAHPGHGPPQCVPTRWRPTPPPAAWGWTPGAVRRGRWPITSRPGCASMWCTGRGVHRDGGLLQRQPRQHEGSPGHVQSVPRARPAAFALLGDMLELGEISPKKPTGTVGALAAESRLDGLPRGLWPGGETLRPRQPRQRGDGGPPLCDTYRKRRPNCCWPGSCSPATRCWSRPAGAWRWKKCSKSFTMSKNKKKYQLE